MGFFDKVNNLVETIKNAVSGGSSSNESSAHSSGGGTSSDAARSAAQAAAAKYQADGQKRTTSTKSSTNNVLVDSVKHTPTSSGRTYSGTGTKAQNPEKAEKKAAAQTAADIAQQRGQSRTNYLKTYKTEESNYQAPKYKSSEDLNGARANAYDPADRYIAQAEGARNSTVDYMTGAERKAAEKASKRPKNYLSEADFKQMDINDSYSPNWTNDQTWQQLETEGKDFSIPKWFQNVAGSVLNSVGGSFSSNAGIAYEAGNEGRIQQGTEAMNDAWRTYVQALYAQATSDNPSEFNANVESAMRNLKGFADAIGPGVFEQTVANAENAMAEYRKDPNNFDIEYWLNNGNSGTLPDLTTFEGASIATRDLAQSMFAQSQAQNEAAKAALGNTTAGNILTDVAINLAEQGIDAAVGFLGSMGAAPQIASKVYQSISLGNMALRVFGQTASQVRDEGGNFGQQTFEAGLAAGVEVLTEKMSGGIAKFYGKGDTDEIVEEIARRVTQSDFGRSVIRTIGGMTGEAVEEVISTVVDPVVRAVHDSEATDKYATAEGRQEIATEAGYSALVAALAALAGSSATYINGSNAQANAALTQTDQIQAELESNGMSTKDARKVAPNVQKYQSEGFEGLSKSEQKTLTNPLIRSIYGIDIELDSATDTINKQTDGKRVKPAQVAAAEKTMSDRLTPEIFAEYKKFNDESQTRETVMAAADAFNNELFDAVEGDVILDQNNRPVGTVKTVNDYGITIQYNDGTTESAVFMGNNGLLDPKSNLAKVFNDGGGVVAQDDADIIIRSAEQERKAQIKAGEEMQNRGEKAQPQTAQPQQTVPAPHKAPTPAKANQQQNQQTTQEQTPQQEAPKQEAPTGPQFQNQDVYDNNKYEVEQSANGYYVKQPDGGLVGPFETHEQAMGMVSQFSQQNPTPQTQETQEAETPVQTQEESQPEATQEQEAPSEPEAPQAPENLSPVAQQILDNQTVTENNGTPSKAEQYFADNPKKTTYQTTYKEAGVKIKKNADGTYTVSMASPKKSGQGWTKAVSAIGTVNSISEANQLVVDEYAKKTAPKALTDSATGTPLKSPQNASQSVSREEGNSVLPNEQNASEAQNEELNSKPEAETEEQPQNPLAQTEEKTKNPLKPTPEAISQASLDYNIIEYYDFEERQQALTELPLEQIVALYRYAQNLQNLPENYGQYPNASFGMAIEEAYHDALRKYQDENVEQMRQENLRNKGANKNPQKYSDYQTPVNEDSTGKPLTQGQANFFSKSTLRDALGRLIRFFHGTGNLGHTSYDFSYADDGRTLWLSNSKDVTSSYSGAVNEDGYLDGRTMGASNAPVYVNMEKPFILDGQGSLWNQIEITDDVASVLEQLGYSFDRSEPLFYGDDGTGKYANTRELAAYAYAMGYDGIVIKNIIDYGPAEIEVNRYAPADILAVFSSNQVKDVKNENPTKSEDYRFKQDINGESVTLSGGTVSAETVQDALMGKTVSEGAANYEGTLSEKQVAKLSPVQVIQRLQNYAKKARTSIKGLLKHITSDESGEALIGREAYTKQLIESSVGETRGMNAQGEYEDEVDVIGGEDDTRKERPKRSVEEAQEEVNDINRSNLMTLGDTIRDAMKAANIGRYRSGIDGICDWILDKGRQRKGDAPTQAEYEAFRDLVKKMLNDEYHRQNNYKKDKNGNLVDINWKKFNTAKVLDLIDTALAGEADVDALNDADFTEINALLERAAKIRIGYGETKNSRLGDVYSGYMDLRSILEGDEAFQEDLNSEIYDGTNLTAGEKWITDEDGNEIKVSDEEGWRENSKEQDRRFGWYDRGDATDGMTQAERDEYEESYWAQNGERDIANMWQQKSEQTGKGNSVVEEYLPSTSPRLSKKPGVDLPTSISGVTVTQEANELSNAAIELISKKLREMGDLQHAINRNAQDIADIKANPSGNAVVDNAKIKQHERMIESLQKRLAPYEAWASKIEGQYTINDLLNDSFLTEAEKEAFKAQLDKDVRFGRIDLQTIALNNRIDSTTYYLQVGDGMFRQLLDTKTNTQLKAIVEQHEQNIKNLQRRIADNKEYVKSLNPINKSLIDKYNKAIEAAENRLAREQEWLKKATGKAGSYTLNDYFADPFIRQYYADEVKGIDTETKENGVAVFGNYQFNGLRNAKSWDFANDLIKDIKKGVLSGELSEHGFNSRGEVGRSLNGERLGLGETTIAEPSVYDQSAYGYGAGESQAGTQASGTERENALLNRGRTQTSGTGVQTGDRTAAGNSQSVRATDGRQNNVGLSGQSSDAQSTRNPFTGRDNQTVFKDVSDAWNKSNGNTEDVTRNLVSKGYSVTTYRDGKTIVITDKQRPVGTFSNKDGRNTRLNNRLKNNPNFTAYSASRIAVIETNAYGETTVEMKLGLLAFNRKTRETTLYAANVDSANHELNHDDWTLADNAISDRILSGENIDTIDDMFHNGLVKALDDIGVDYKTLSQYIQSLDYQADEVDEELFAELNAVMYDGSTSDWDGDTSISDIAHKLMQHEEFQNLVAQIRAYADEAMQAIRGESTVHYKQDLDQYSDESFDALVNDTSYEEASAINGQNYDEYDLNSEFNAEQASETETLNNMSSRGVDTTAAPIENFQNAEQASENAAVEDLSGTGVDTERTPIDYFQSQEQASESDLIREQSRNDLTGSEDTNFESPYEAEQRTEQEAMDSLYENMDGRKLTSPKRTANDYYGSAYARVQETQKKHKRNKARSSFSIAELYYKTYGETNDSIRNFKRLQRLNSNVDSLLDGKMSYYDFNSFAKNMSTRQGIGQILNDDIQSELDRVVALEEAAQDKNASEQDVADFQYAAANVVSHIVARMDMVEKTERARARLDTAAKKHGAKGGRKNLVGTALDAWNRYQITGDNFWRMMDDWAGKGQGYSYAREHLKTIATRISEEAKLKGYFEGIDKNSKEFKDFASGTTMSNVDFNGHKVSLMEGIKFVKTVDTLRMFASENGRPNWQRVAALGGFTFEGKNGKPIFVDIQGSYDNNAEARAKWVEQRYNQLKQEIANNKSASAYMSAVEEMYYEASKDAEKVHSKVNGYDRYMYGKGWYTDIHYANKNSGTVDFRYSDRDATDVHDTASMQKRSKVAGGYAIINPMSRSVDAYISQISNYIAFEEFGQKLGVLSDSKSINGSYANTIRDAYGDQYAQWFDNYVKTMTLYKENKPKGGMNSALAKARQAMMSGALIGSVSVPIKQVSSFFDTMGTLDPRAVAAVFVQNPLGRKQKGIKNYLMDSRNQNISDPDLAELFGDKGILRKIKGTRIGKLAISATNMMDATAVSNVYRACVLDVEYNNPLGKGIYNNGKNFKDGLTPDGQFYVDAKFEEALLGSQPIFTPQARNELARTDNQFARMFSTFRTQQTQNYNRMLQTWNEYQAARKNDGDTKETGKKFVQTMTGQMIASASLSALTAIANAVLHKHKRYKDDDDELDEEKFWQRFGLGAFESLMGNSLFVGDITKWAIDLYNSQNDPNWNWKYSTKESQYFDAIEGMHIPIPASGAIGTAIQALNSAINLYRDVDENGWSDQNKLSARYLAGNIATAFGVQLNNVYNALNAGYQWYMDAAQLVTGDKKYEKKYDDIFTQMVKVDYSQQNRLVNSILAGKTQKVADMFDDMGQDKFENAVYYGAFDQYKAGKIDKAEYVELLMNFAGKSYKEASNEVEKKSRLLESGISQYNGIDGRDGRKAFYDQYSGNFQSRDAYKQFFEDVKNGKAEGKHNTYYTQWYGQPQEVSANQSSIIDTMNRNIQAGNFSYATAKLLWENYYGYSTSRYSAWKFVGK